MLEMVYVWYYCKEGLGELGGWMYVVLYILVGGVMIDVSGCWVSIFYRVWVLVVEMCFWEEWLVWLVEMG